MHQITLNPIYKTESNRLQAKIRKELKKHSQETWKNRLLSLNTQDNSFWNIQKIFKNKRVDIPALHTASGIAITDEQKANLIANTMKDNFTENTRPADFRNSIDSDVKSTLERFFSHPPPTPISPTNPDEVAAYVNKLKVRKTPGKDNITNKMIRNFPIKALIILTYLINKILLLRHFPNNWKIAVIFPIKKPGKSSNNPQSFRPISLLSTLSKITEHIILNRINSFISDTNLINPNQYGFTKKLSTNHPLLRITEKITSGFQRGRSTGAVFLDIQKAFDRVWISGLIYKLINYNFPPSLIHLINSYLVNRIYQVRVNNTLSDTHNINIGCPQGSLLGPILFNLYINDMPTHPQTMLNLYADDTCITATFKNHNTITIALNRHLSLLEEFFNKWKIKINVDKTVTVLFTSRRKHCTPPALYSTPLQWSQSTKYLGVILDNKLTWKQHVIHTRNKFRFALRLLFPLINRNSHMSLENKVLLYTAVLRPILSYASPVWGYAAKSNIKILEVSQNSLIRRITKSTRRLRNSRIYKELELLPFKTFIQSLAKKFFNDLEFTNNLNLIDIQNYTLNDNTKRPRRILLDSYNPP
ncbi:RNA-directed DNA polymerase from mobile element jockey [Trichonephila clavipes]|nr:RNA-directed DNA polymerase from mobile element jockey [Trichonephila clavipes]